MLCWLLLQTSQASMMRDLSGLKGLTDLRGLRDLTDLTIRLLLLRWGDNTHSSTSNHQRTAFSISDCLTNTVTAA